MEDTKVSTITACDARDGGKSRMTRKTRLFLIILGLSYIAALVTTVYFAVKKSNEGETSSKLEYTAEDLLRLELEIAERFRYYHCNDGNKNSFSLYEADNYTRYCYYVFTDNQPQWYIENGCELFWGEPLHISRDSEQQPVYGTIDVALDFQICCLNYFRENGLPWWQSLSSATKRNTFYKLSLSYELHAFENCAIEPTDDAFGSLQTKCNCSWGEFDQYWKSMECSFRPEYSHMCLYTEYSSTGVIEEPGTTTTLHPGDIFG